MLQLIGAFSCGTLRYGNPLFYFSLQYWIWLGSRDSEARSQRITWPLSEQKKKIDDMLCFRCSVVVLGDYD